MKTTLRTLLLALCLLAVAPPVARADDPAFVLVVHRAAGVTSLKRDEIRDILLGQKKTWPSGELVQLVLPSDAESGQLQWLAQSFFNTNGKLLMTRLNQGVFKGDLRRPVSASDDIEVLKAVSQTKGGIGVVHSAFTRPPETVAIAVSD